MTYSVRENRAGLRALEHPASGRAPVRLGHQLVAAPLEAHPGARHVRDVPAFGERRGGLPVHHGPDAVRMDYQRRGGSPPRPDDPGGPPAPGVRRARVPHLGHMGLTVNAKIKTIVKQPD